MAARTVSSGNDVEAALAFLAKEIGVTGEQYFMNKVQTVFNEILEEADSKRFELVKKTLDEKNKGESIAKLRELLGAG